MATFPIFFLPLVHMLWRRKTSAELWGLETAQLHTDLIMQSTPLGASRLLNFQCVYIYIYICVCAAM